MISVLQRSQVEKRGLVGSGIGMVPLRNPILFLETRAILKDRD